MTETTHNSPNTAEIDNILSRGVENVFPNKEFVSAKMLAGEKFTIYLGIDPTGPTLHLGHTIPLRKLGALQKLGHKIIMLIGDFTAMIGDPTDKTSARKKMSREEVLANCSDYISQASRFITFTGENKADVKYNSEWLATMNFGDVLELASQMTVDQMLKRDMFVKRMEEGKPVYIHEFLYPLMQGYDTVAMDADGEIGGNDQTFNMLAGRDLMKSLKNKEKFVIATKLLTDPTGKKMGKSENNMVALNQTPEDIFGKVMSWPDSLIIPGFEIATDVPLREVEKIKSSMEAGENPKDFKKMLAKEIIKICKGEEYADQAEENFEKTFAKGGIPNETREVEVASQTNLVDIMIAENIIESKTEWRRLVADGAVTIMESGETVGDPNSPAIRGTYKVGKRRFLKIKIIQ